MYGWWGRVLRINLTNGKVSVNNIEPDVLVEFIGGRGLAIRILWDELIPGVDPLSPYNKLVIASGPLSGLPGPSTGKLVVASKSPLTNGYGDGNIGTLTSVYLRKTGFDAIVIEGVSKKPVYIHIEDDKVDIRDAEDLWGRDAFDTEDRLIREHGRNIGALLIGPAGENMVRYATVVSMKGRSGGRPGIGAVMGSKKLKAIVVRGTREVKLAKPDEYRKVVEEAYRDILSKENYDFWIRQGTMATIVWSQQNSVLPTMNFREGMWDYYETISGDLMEKLKVKRRGCPYCNMMCGNVILDIGGEESELDYENVAMLGSNILLTDLRRVAEINKICDQMGMDTISFGNAIGFLMEASERGYVKERVEWGDHKIVKEVAYDTAYRRGLGSFVAEGVMRMSRWLRGDSVDFAIHVKGLEVSAYDCHAAPAMALAYGTSPIGAHHKDAWIISYEVKVDRLSYSRDKVEKLVYLQNIRGGMFESLTTCRLPWVEVGLDLNYYPKLLSLATGFEWNFDKIYEVANRIYTLIRAFWIREYGYWSREMDYPPMRWFKHPLTKGPYAGVKLDINKYNEMLDMYYQLRGWDERGVPRRETLEKLGLKETINVLDSIVGLK
ncbi:MAG: aldehyde ferredoxin oxidoreductase family protein [Desulfurococcaceae archaeon]